MRLVGNVPKYQKMFSVIKIILVDMKVNNNGSDILERFINTIENRNCVKVVHAEYEGGGGETAPWEIHHPRTR